ncbi:nucleotidyltransferase family protein [Georgenia alba]|uniref:NTP transferase domain-containing protein n=1 Tax=Georgenia alba TaxID=2233858 RepID=A0ABW2Q328_9MICO
MAPDSPSDVVGIVLAAGAGRRMGRPKVLVRDGDGVPWLHRAVALVRAAGADPVLVALGAAADEAAKLVPPGATTVVVPDWSTGMAASLRAALEAAEAATHAVAALVTLVDLPDLRVEAARRVLGEHREPDDLRQAAYDGTPGHPVLIGRRHWAPLRSRLSGDVGAKHYLRENGAEILDCTDLGGGNDVDR